MGIESLNFLPILRVEGMLMAPYRLLWSGHDARQFQGDYIHQAPEPLHPTVPSWSFEAWGMDVLGSHQTSLSPLRCATSRCRPSFVASLSSALPRTDLPPQLLLPSFTYCLRKEQATLRHLPPCIVALLFARCLGAPLITHITRQPNLFIHYSNVIPCL